MKHFERAGVARNIEVKIGDAREIVPRIRGYFDLIFQDVGDKSCTLCRLTIAFVF
jgi:predicted O-methyltransferase YrrM